MKQKHVTVFVLLETILEQTEADGLTVDLMCYVSASIMFLLIRVVGGAGIYPSRNTPSTGPQSIMGYMQKAHSRSHSEGGWTCRVQTERLGKWLQLVQDQRTHLFLTW